MTFSADTVTALMPEAVVHFCGFATQTGPAAQLSSQSCLVEHRFYNARNVPPCSGGHQSTEGPNRLRTGRVGQAVRLQNKRRSQSRQAVLYRRPETVTLQVIFSIRLVLSNADVTYAIKLPVHE